jgi:hypothetical protein
VFRRWLQVKHAEDSVKHFDKEVVARLVGASERISEYRLARELYRTLVPFWPVGPQTVLSQLRGHIA